MYHRISIKENEWSFSPVSPYAFEEQMKFLKKNFTIVPLSELRAYIEGEKHVKNNRIAIITFDDGYKDNYIYAIPILKKYQIPATIYLTSGHINTKRLFWWDRLGYAIYHSSKETVHVQGLGSYSISQEAEKERAIRDILTRLKRMDDDSKTLILEHIWKECHCPDTIQEDNQMITTWDNAKEMLRNGIEFGAHTVNHPILANM